MDLFDERAHRAYVRDTQEPSDKQIDHHPRLAKRRADELRPVTATHARRHGRAPQARHFAGLLMRLTLPSTTARAGSYGDFRYGTKLPHYLSQNILARSLHPQCYEKSPKFLKFITETGLKFRPYEEFKAADIHERSELYRQIAKRIWNPSELLEIANVPTP